MSGQRRHEVVDEYERRHYAIMIEGLLRQGCSEREVVEAIERSTWGRQPAPRSLLRRTLERFAGGA